MIVRIIFTSNESERAYAETEAESFNEVADKIDRGEIKMPYGCNGYELKERVKQV